MTVLPARNSTVTVTSAGDLLVYGGTSSPTVLLSADGKLLASSDKLKGDRVLMMPDGKVWAKSAFKIVSGSFSGVPVEHSYEDKWGNPLSGVRDMCADGNDLLVCGSNLLTCRNGQWIPLYEPKGTSFSRMAVDREGVIWLVSGEGVVCMGKDGKTPPGTLASLNTPEGKKDLGYTIGLYADANGNLWIVTPGDVIVYNRAGLVGLLAK